MKTRTKKGFGKKRGAVWALGAALLLNAPVARALEDSPFQTDTANWMSVDHYKDAVKRGTLEEELKKPPPPPPPPPTATPAVAIPSRPVDLPVMPGINKGLNVQVDSTLDDLTPPPVIGTNTATDLLVSDKTWQTPASAKADGGDEAPLNVRMTYLPDKTVAPVPDPEHPPAQHRSVLEKKPETKDKTEAEAAWDAYKKQQLDAIQSDRQTLKALQDAISSLGLQKQLDFMAGKKSSLATAPAPDAAPANAPPPPAK